MACKERISRYRDELKGFAILWVVFFHALIDCEGVLGDVQKLGYGGVDIFFFLTGFGLYHSLQKQGDLRVYWHRRMRKLLPAYLPLILCWIVVMFPGYGLSTVQAIRSAVGNLLFWGYWFSVPKTFNWYMAGLALALLLAPFFHGLLSKSEKPGRALALILGTLVLAGFACVGLDQYMAVSRLPVFVLGMAFAMDWRPRLGTAAKWLLCGLSLTTGLALVLLCHDRYPELLLTYGMYWHPFILITPPLCVLAAEFLHRAERARAWFQPLRLLGRASFEVYLLNIWTVELGKKHALTGNWEWLWVSLGGIALGIGYHFLVSWGTGALAAKGTG